MGHPKGFLLYERKEAGNRPINERIYDYGEVEQTLNAEDAIAGIKNEPQAFKSPIPTEASETNKRNGDRIRVIWAVSSIFSGMAAYPEARR